MTGVMSRDRERCQFLFCLIKSPLLCRAARPESGREAREVAATVLVLRAHYTMDVFAAALAAFFAYSLGATVAPAVDTWIASLF
jgi:hypothetical protein